MREKHKEARDATTPISTTGEFLADGCIIEPVRDAADAERLSLLLWDGAKSTVGPCVEHAGRIYEPAPIDRTILGALRLPRNTAPYGSARQLLTAISKVGMEYTGLAEQFVAKVGRVVLGSWFLGAIPAGPWLSVVGPDTIGGVQLLKLLHCLCRHPLRLTEVNVADLCSLPLEWGLTLLIHQRQLSPRVLRLLAAARERSAFIPRRGRLVNPYCTIATYSEVPGGYSLGTTPGIEIPVGPSSRLLPILDDHTQEQIADDLQPKLLACRIENLAKVCNSRFDAPELTYPMREVARSLGACTPDDPDLQAELIHLLEEQDAEIRAARWTDFDTVVIEGVLFHCHEAGRDFVYVGEITETVETILQERSGKSMEVNPGLVGKRLRDLRLMTEPRDSKGVRLLLTKAVRRHAHELGRDYQVPSMQDGVERCQHCKVDGISEGATDDEAKAHGKVGARGKR